MFILAREKISDLAHTKTFYTGFGWSLEYPDAQEYLRRREALRDAKLALSPEYYTILIWNYGGVDEKAELVLPKLK